MPMVPVFFISHFFKKLHVACMFFIKIPMQNTRVSWAHGQKCRVTWARDVPKRGIRKNPLGHSGSETGSSALFWCITTSHAERHTLNVFRLRTRVTGQTAHILGFRLLVLLLSPGFGYFGSYEKPMGRIS